MRIAICGGHHQDARGAVNKKYGLNEYEEARKVCQYLREKLHANGAHVSVFSGTLKRKIGLINYSHFDIAIDIHFNAGGGNGCEVIHNPKSPKRKEAAGLMSLEIASFLNVKNRGAKEGYWMGGDNPGTIPDAFVSRTECAAFIIEPLFIDNDDEVGKWLVADRHDEIAEAIYRGIEAAGW